MSNDNPFKSRAPQPAPSGSPASAPKVGAGSPPSAPARKVSASGSQRLSLLPTLVAIALIAVGVFLAFLVLRGMNSDATLPLAVIGYVLTPFMTATCLIWARALDLRGQSEANYLRADGQRRLRILGLLVLLSFIPALAFIWYIASYVGSVIA
jgi:hypothetical protein